MKELGSAELRLFLRGGVGVVKSTENPSRDDMVRFGRTGLAGNGRGAQRLVAATFVVIGDELAEDPPEMSFAEDDEVVEALPSERPIDAFDEAVLPG